MDTVKIFELIDNKDIRALAYVHTVTDINYQDKNGNTMLHRAAMNENHEILDFLIFKKADVNIKNKSFFTALVICVYTDDSQAVEKLLKAGADTEIAESNGCTPLVIAVDKNHQKIVQLLINYKANTNIINTKTGEPLILSCRDKSLRTIFINAGSNVLSSDNEGMCTVHQIIDDNDVEILELLKNRGFNFNALLPDGYMPLYQTPLMYAADSQETACIKKLLDYKADIHYQHKSSANCFIGYLALYQQDEIFNEIISKADKKDFSKLKIQLEKYTKHYSDDKINYINAQKYIALMNKVEIHDKLDKELKEKDFHVRKNKI